MPPIVSGEVPFTRFAELLCLLISMFDTYCSKSYVLARKNMEKPGNLLIKIHQHPIFPRKEKTTATSQRRRFHVYSVGTAPRARLLDCRHLPLRRRAASLHLLPACVVLSGGPWGKKAKNRSDVQVIQPTTNGDFGLFSHFNHDLQSELNSLRSRCS